MQPAPDPEILAARLLELIEQALRQHLLDGDALRMLGVGLSPTGDALLLFANNEWESYSQQHEDRAFARIANEAWLDELDALALAHPGEDFEVHGRAALEALRQRVEKALRLLAVEPRLHELPQSVGLFTQGLDDIDDYIRIIAFCHPHGDQELLPLRESRQSYSSLYPWGVLHEEGLTMFYFEDDDEDDEDFDDEDDEDDEEELGRTRTHTYAFADMELAYTDKDFGSDDGVCFRIKGNSFDHKIEDGHTHPELGGLTDDEITARLRAHFSAQTHLFFDPGNPPDPQDQNAYARWQQRYFASADNSPGDRLRTLAERHGPGAAIGFVEAMPLQNKWHGKTTAILADVLAEAGDWEQALEYTQRIQGGDRAWLHALEPRCLVMLERFEEALQAAAPLIEKDDHFYRPKGLAVRALALDALGRNDEAEREARALTEALPDAGMAFYALAHALRLREPAEAARLYEQAASKDRFDDTHARHDFADAPAVLGVIEAREGLQAQRDETPREAGAGLQSIHVPWLFKGIEDIAAHADTATTYWRKSRTFDEDHAPRFNASVQLSPGRFLVRSSDDERGVEVLDFDEALTPTLTPTGLQDPSLAYTGWGEYACVSNYTHGLQIAHIGDTAQPVSVPLSFDGHASDIAAMDGVIAVAHSAGVDLYDTTNIGAPVLRASIGQRSNALLLMAQDGRRYALMAGNDPALVVTDITQLEKPHVLVRMDCVQEDESTLGARRLQRHGQWLLLDDEHDTTWILDITDPARPRSLGLLPLCHQGDEAWVDGDDLLIAREDWIARLRLNGDTGIRVLSVSGFEDEETRLCENNLRLGKAVLALDYEGAAWLEETPLPEVNWPGEAQIAALYEPLLKGIESMLEKLAESDPAFHVGMLRLGYGWGRFSIALDAPRTRHGLNHSVSETPPSLDFEVGNLVAAESRPQSIPEGLPALLHKNLERRKAQAYRGLVIKVLEGLGSSEALRAIAGGRVLLVEDPVHPHELRVIDTLVLEDRPYTPKRCTYDGLITPDIEALLSSYQGYEHLDRVEQLAQHDPTVFARVLRLAETGEKWALVAARNQEDLDPEAVLEAFIKAAQGGHLSTLTVGFIRKHREHPAADAILQAAYESDDIDPMALAMAAKALGLLESDRVAAVIKRLLAEPYPGPHDTGLSILEAFQTRLAEFIEPLIQAISTDNSMGDIVARVGEQLLRAGHPTPPPALLERAKEDKRYEDVSENKPYPACTVARRWIGQLMAEHLGELDARQDLNSPLWPSDYEPEPHRSSWRHFIDAAWPALEAKGPELTGFFVRALSAHTAGRDEWLNDQAMMPGVLGYCAERPELLDLAVALAQAMTAEDSALEKKDRDYAARVLNHELIVQAQAHIEKGELGEARRIVDALLRGAPNEPEVLFRDALLTLKEKDPQAAMDRLDQTLPRLSSVHAPRPFTGRARLLNLYGCLLDMQERWDEAKDWFAQAQVADPGEVVYYDNLAEIYDKLGERDSALNWARQAKKKGSRSDIVARVLDAANA